MATMTEAPAATLTYEAYMAEPEVQGRYDIVNGVRVFMPGATWDHQTVAMSLVELLRQYARASGVGKVNTAPFDVLIRRVPKLQTRQPDVLMVSFARLARVGGRPAKGPLEVAPELVVEIISDSETHRISEDKLTDYIAIGVEECWVVRPDAGTVEVLALTPDGARSVATYREGQAVASRVFSGLAVAVADVFAP
jgi:Uma2 family endonuclease